MWAPLLAGIPNYAKGSLFVPDLDDNEKVLKIILYTLKACPENLYIYYLFIYALSVYCCMIILYRGSVVFLLQNPLWYKSNRTHRE